MSSHITSNEFIHTTIDHSATIEESPIQITTQKSAKEAATKFKTNKKTKRKLEETDQKHKKEKRKIEGEKFDNIARDYQKTSISTDEPSKTRQYNPLYSNSPRLHSSKIKQSNKSTLPQSSVFCHWDERLNSKLIDTWRKHQRKFRNGNLRNIDVWNLIASELHTMIDPNLPKPTTLQCWNRWKNMKMTCIKRNKKPGIKRRACPYFKEMNEIYGEQPHTMPQKVLSKSTITNGNIDEGSTRDADSSIPNQRKKDNIKEIKNIEDEESETCDSILLDSRQCFVSTSPSTTPLVDHSYSQLHPSRTKSLKESTSALSPKDSFFWNDKSLSLKLIDCWLKHQAKFENSHYTKRQVWELISSELHATIDPDMSKPTTLQCRNRWRTMKKYFRDWNNKPGNVKKCLPYFYKMNEIYGEQAPTKAKTACSTHSTHTSANKKISEDSNEESKIIWNNIVGHSSSQATNNSEEDRNDDVDDRISNQEEEHCSTQAKNDIEEDVVEGIHSNLSDSPQFIVSNSPSTTPLYDHTFSDPPQFTVSSKSSTANKKIGEDNHEGNDKISNQNVLVKWLDEWRNETREYEKINSQRMDELVKVAKEKNEILKEILNELRK